MAGVRIPAQGVGDTTPLVETETWPNGERQVVTSPRYSGGLTPLCATVTAIGDTTILTPSAGMALRVYWVQAQNDPDVATQARIIARFGAAGLELYRNYAVSHWEPFTGGVNQELRVNLDVAAPGRGVTVTVHYKEV